MPQARPALRHASALLELCVRCAAFLGLVGLVGCSLEPPSTGIRHDQPGQQDGSWQPGPQDAGPPLAPVPVAWSVAPLDFGPVPVGGSAMREVELRATEAWSPVLREARLVGNADFMLVGDTTVAVGARQDLDGLVVQPGVPVRFIVRFRPESAGDLSATLELYAESGGAPVTLELRGHGRDVVTWWGGQPVVPQTLGDETAVTAVRLEVEGNTFVSIDDITLAQPLPAAFTVTGVSSSFHGNAALLPTAMQPVTLGPGDHLWIDVAFSPQVPAADVPLPAELTATLHVHADAPIKPLVLSGTVMHPTCPAWQVTTTVVASGEGGYGETAWRLDASKSIFPTQDHGQITWKARRHQGPWVTVGMGPVLDAAPFLPGLWTLCASVPGNGSCTTWCTEVDVAPPSGLFVELTWTSKGAGGVPKGDLPSLHLGRTTTPGGGLDYDCDGVPEPWFSPSSDCFALAGQSAWSTWPGTNQPAALYFAGAAPNAQQVWLQEPGTAASSESYRIAVHMIDTWKGAGVVGAESKVVVSVYVGGSLAGEFPRSDLVPGDLWTLGTVHWPNVLTGGKGAPLALCGKGASSCSSGGDPCVVGCVGEDGLPVTACQ